MRAGHDRHAAIADPLGFLPAAATVVVALDLVHLHQGSLWQTWAPAIHDRVVALATGCKSDPLEHAGTVTIAFTALDPDPPAGTIVVRDGDAKQLLACFGAFGNAQVAALDATTIVGVFGPHASAGALEAAIAAGSPLAGNAAFADVFAQVDTHRALWFVVAPHAPVLRTLAGLANPPVAIFGSFDATDFLAADIHVRLADAAAAAGFHAMASGQLGGVKPFVERLDLTTVDRDVVFALAMSAAQLTQLLGIVGVTPP